MAITICVGDVYENVAVFAQSLCSDAFLIDHTNYKRFLESQIHDQNLVAYTSFGDLPKITRDRCVFFEVLNNADKIYYCPPDRWSDAQQGWSTQSAKIMTEFFLHVLHTKKKNVSGLDLCAYSKSPYLDLAQSRTTDQPALWIAGCSITAGVGVSYEDKWPFRVAHEFFNGDFIDLSRPGSSLDWQSDQLLRSDIRTGDTVVWGLTSEYRAAVWNHDNYTVDFLNPFGFDHLPSRADDITDETRLYKAITCCKQVVNFCRKIDATLLMFPTICSENLQLLLHDEPSYYQISYRHMFIDVGSDRVHPGPLQHKLYADHVSLILRSMLIAH